MLLKALTGQLEKGIDAVADRSNSIARIKRRIATGAAAILAVGFGYHVVFGANGLTVYEQKRQETKALHVQMDALQRENDQLKGHVERLQTDPNAIEHQAREELHYTRAGEVIFTMPGTPASTEKVPVAPETAETN